MSLALAMHEAAHCVLAHRNGIRVESVSIAAWEDFKRQDDRLPRRGAA